MLRERRESLKKNELRFGIVKHENPKRHLREQIQEAARKTGLQIQRVWWLKYSLEKQRAEPTD